MVRVDYFKARENNKVKIGEMPVAYWGNLKESWEAHNKDYSGVYKA